MVGFLKRTNLNGIFFSWKPRRTIKTAHKGGRYGACMGAHQSQRGEEFPAGALIIDRSSALGLGVCHLQLHGVLSHYSAFLSRWNRVQEQGQHKEGWVAKSHRCAQKPMLVKRRNAEASCPTVALQMPKCSISSCARWKKMTAFVHEHKAGLQMWD